jgi:hypothetical protein
MRTDAVLPDRCIKCSRPTKVHVRKRLFWADTDPGPRGGAGRFIPYVRIGFAFESMFRWLWDIGTMRAPVVHIPLCFKHRWRGRLFKMLSILCFAAVVPAFKFAHEPQLKVWLPVATFFTAAIFWVSARTVTAAHIGVGYVTLKGVGRRFLQSIATDQPLAARSAEDISEGTAELRNRMLAKKSAHTQ